MNERTLKAATVLAYGCLYVVWGTTYLAIALAIRTLPPFTTGAARFLVAAGLMYAWLRVRRPDQLERLPWRHALTSGVLLGGMGNGLVVWAQQGLPSGVAALILSTIPVTVLLLNWAFFERRAPSSRALLGISLALAGVTTIVSARHGVGGDSSPVYLIATLCAVLAWSTGTLRQRQAARPGQLLGITTVQMLAAGLFQGGMAVVNREWIALDTAQVSLESIAAVAYLAVFGSIIALNCYVWLLTREPAQKVATYALVNPVIAVLLGAIVLGEKITVFTVIGATCVLAGVALVLFQNLRWLSLSGIAMRWRAARRPAPADGCPGP